MAKFNIGDRVCVIDDGRTYPAYRRLAEQMGVESKWNKGKLLPNGNEGVVVSNAMHENWDEMIYAVRADHRGVFLIGERGIALVERKLAPLGSTFKPGDKVRIKDLSHIKVYSSQESEIEAGVQNCVTEEMQEEKGRVFVIRAAGHGGYRLENYSYCFLPEWLELYVQTPEEKIAELEAEVALLKKEKAEISAQLWEVNQKLFKVQELVR